MKGNNMRHRVSTSIHKSTTPPSQSAESSHRTRNGKVARLSYASRRVINEMLHEGLPYAEIIEELGEDGAELNEDNITNWKAGGYQDWLREQQCLVLMRNQQDFALDLISQNKLSKIHEATLQIAVTHICGLLRDFDSDSLKDVLATDPLNFTRLLNVLAKLAHGGLQCERDRLARLEGKARVDSVVQAINAFGKKPKRTASNNPGPSE
jgi:hypothetical protein